MDDWILELSPRLQQFFKDYPDVTEAVRQHIEELEERDKVHWKTKGRLVTEIGELEDALRGVKKITTSALKQMSEEEDFYWVKEMSEIDMIAQKVLDGK